MVLKVATKKEFDSILQNHERVAVDFTATWCGPCKMIGPKFEKLAEKYSSIKFIKVDVDENSETSEAHGIAAMPTFKFFRNGSEGVSELVGASETELDAKLQALASA
ncbi:uncharacterized protein LOC100205970 isoform X3 [Hydra vulgaris]|uniref:Thioredoxin n=1 Tax=Hydra vulgaris TaxID=6087 RepID=A0ABM4BEH2_HYDVU